MRSTATAPTSPPPQTECGILTALINSSHADNPDVRVDVNVVAWPGYPQLTAQIAAGDPPDLVTMHQSVIADYQGRGLLEPMDGVLAQAGITRAQFTDAGAPRGRSRTAAPTPCRGTRSAGCCTSTPR